MFLIGLSVVLIVLVIVSSNRIYEVSRRLHALDREVRELKKQIASQPQPEEPPSAEPVSVQQMEPPSPPREPGAVAKLPVTETVMPITEPERPVSEESRPEPPRTRGEWETLIGGKWFNRIGAVALIIATGFFLKYAFEHDWVTQTMRLLIAVVIGLGLLFVGSRYHRRGFTVFAQGLLGAGVSILYLTVYSSFNLYHLVPLGIALVFVAAVTILTFFNAFKYDSLAVALLGLAGGFITPLLLVSQRPNVAGLFFYIIMIDIGILLLVARKIKWAILEPFALLGTYIVYSHSRLTHYGPENILFDMFFLSIVLALFYAHDIYGMLKHKIVSLPIRHIVSSTNALFYFVAVFSIVNPQYHSWMAFVTLLIGIAYFVPLLVFQRLGLFDEETIPQRYALTAIFFLVAATAIQFSEFTAIILWTTEALVLVWCGIQWKWHSVWQAGLVLFCIALLWLLPISLQPDCGAPESFVVILNMRALAFLSLVAALGISSLLFTRLDHKDTSLIRSTLSYGWVFLLFFWMTWETGDYFRHLRRYFKEVLEKSSFLDSQLKRLTNIQQLSVSLLWLLYSIICMVVGIWRRIPRARIIAMVLFGLTICKVFFYDLNSLPTLYRIFSFVCLGVILLIVSYLYQRYRAVILEEAK